MSAEDSATPVSNFPVRLRTAKRRDLPGEGLPQPPAWTADALCNQTDPESFFPEKGGSTREAKRICRRCTVSAECLTYALDNEERFGIWGGFSERERRKLNKPDSPAA